MLQFIKISLVGLLLFLLLSFGFIVEASGLKITNPLSSSLFKELLNTVLNSLFWIALPIGIFLIIVGGFYLIISGGDPQKIETAKTLIIVALISLVIISTTHFIIRLTQKLFGIAPLPSGAVVVTVSCNLGGFYSNPSLYCSSCDHCSDGIRNCGETGIDCGGSCGACMAAMAAAPVISNPNVTPISAPEGTIFVITVEVSSSAPVTVTAFIQQPDENNIISFILWDDGAHNDSASNDGIYGNGWNSTGYSTGAYFIDISACNLGGCAQLENI